jgi:hypothetical protein
MTRHTGPPAAKSPLFDDTRCLDWGELLSLFASLALLPKIKEGK